MSPSQSRTLQLLVIAFGFSLVAVGGLRPLFGHNWYVTAAGLLLAGVISYAALRADGLSLSAVGGSGANLLRAVAVTGAIAGLFRLLLPLTGAASPWLSVLSLRELVEYLALKGGSQELLLRGLMLTSLARLLDRGRTPWRSTLIVALLAGLFHLPTALWVAVPPSDLAMELLIPQVASLLLFGPLYLLSRNLWLVALVHGVALSPLFPALRDGWLPPLLFAAIALLLGRFLLRCKEPLPLTA